MQHNVPIFTSWNSIYPGPHLDEQGNIDDRVWFSIPIDISVEKATITYLVFPYGGTEEDIKELVIEASGVWTG